MTSVPAPLKFLSPHYASLAALHESMVEESDAARALADVLSCLAMISAPEDSRACLRYRLLAPPTTPVDRWGHEYVRHLAGEVGEELQRREAEGGDAAPLLALVDQIVPYDMANNAEPDAIDLLLEVERIEDLPKYVDSGNALRAARYLEACAAYLPEPEDAAARRAAHAVHLRVGRRAAALRLALALGDRELVLAAWRGAEAGAEKLQLAFLLGRAQFGGLDLEVEEADADEATRELYTQALSNTRLAERYASLARDLDVLEVKTPEDVYKSHLVDGGRGGGPALDSARANLASTFVNAFVNAGFGRDALVTVGDGEDASDSSSTHWVFKNKDHGKMSAAASLGLVMLWDTEAGLPAIDRFLYSTDPQVVGGALLGVGVLGCGVADEVDSALAILSDSLGAEDAPPRVGAALGLGIAYAGRRRREVADALCPIVADPDAPLDVAVAAALGLGLTFAGAADGACVEAVLQALLLRGEAELAPGPAGTLLALALGLLFLRRGEAADATLEVLRTLSPNAAAPALATLEACAYAGTGDVLKVQSLLAIAGGVKAVEGDVSGSGEEAASDGGAGTDAAANAPAPPAPQPPAARGAAPAAPPASSTNASSQLHRTIAVLGIALVASGEELGTAMAHRAAEHLLQYGEPAVRRGVPLALALLNVSRPEVTVVDSLSRLSHDADAEVAGGAILALGIVGAGTNNARLASVLRGLSGYYHKEPTLLFLVRVAQGLTHLGKGLLTLDPYHADRSLLAPHSLAGLLTVLFAALDLKACLAGRQHYLFYALAAAARPRWLVTVDEQARPLPVPVRVGTAVDVVAQAGRPKTITGFQTHTTPVLLAAGERAELGTTKYLAVADVLEGVVVLRPNPDYVEEAAE